jgi:tRNA A-37 threonylcarbamoyl transferase component Bud32
VGADEASAFRSLEASCGKLVVRAEFLDAARALGLPAPDAAAALFEAAPAGSGRSATAVIELPGRAERLHLRPVRHGGLLGPLWGVRVLGLARPVAELHVTEALRSRGAPVPQAVLVAGWRAAPLWSAVFGTVQIEGAQDGLAWLETSPGPEEIQRAARAAGRAVRRFHDAGGRHADLHLKNLLLREAGGAAEVSVIDLDKAQATAPPDPRRRMLELMRLYRSLLKRGVFEQVGAAGRSAFFASYTNGDESLARALLTHYPRERRRVARHAWGYRG